MNLRMNSSANLRYFYIMMHISMYIVIVSSLSTPIIKTSTPSSNIYDIITVGGGLSGLTASSMLSQTYRDVSYNRGVT